MSGDGGVQRTPEKDFSTGIEAQSSHSEGELGANGVQDTATYTEVSITVSLIRACLQNIASFIFKNACPYRAVVLSVPGANLLDLCVIKAWSRSSSS